jgi:hypothetical protein
VHRPIDPGAGLGQGNGGRRPKYSRRYGLNGQPRDPHRIAKREAPGGYGPTALQTIPQGSSPIEELKKQKMICFYTISAQYLHASAVHTVLAGLRNHHQQPK